MHRTDQPRVVGGLHLRYLLTWYLVEEGPLTVARIVTLLERDGIDVEDRASKVVSDALRWEIARRRVVRLSRGTYAVGSIPPSTARRIRARARALRR